MTSALIPDAAARTGAGRYRADIDGLRALAVTAVVVYHAFPSWSPGGFAGVDVFFVISGYLITRIVADARDRGDFSFRGFYARRARRILPAFFVMALVVALAAQALLLPDDLTTFGAALGASTLFAANLFFSLTGVYFGPASRDSPLLHVWSLAVEEQFYLVWAPLIVALSLPLFGRLRTALMLLLAAASLAFAEWQIGRGAAREVFYFLPGRAWEFMTGALLALGPIAPPTRAVVANIATLAGYALIGLGLATLNDDSAFPGLGAVAPCLGAAVLIWGGSGEAPIAGWPLRIAPVVALGRISYSLYLWHWPPLVFARLILMRLPGPALAAALVALAVALAALSWRFVEQPWRIRRSPWRHAGLAAGLALVLVGLGAADHFTGGFPRRMPAGLVLSETDINPMRTTCFLGWTPQTTPPAACLLGNPAASGEVLVWGDSHADAVTPGVVAWASGRGLRVREATRAGCPPLTGAFALVDGARADPGCAVFDRNVLALASRPQVKLIVLAARWPMYMNARPRLGDYDPPMVLVDARTRRATDLASALDQTLTAIERSGTTARVFVLGPVPELPFSAPDCVAQAKRFGLDMTHCTAAPDAITLVRANPANAAVERAVQRHPGVTAVLPTRSLCAGDACRATEGGVVLYFDADHLSASGARRLVPGWLDAMRPPAPAAR